MTSLFLLKLTENDKRIIFILLAVVIVLLVLTAYIGYLVTTVMKWQGKKINNHVTDAVITGVITSEDEFKKYANKKNWWLFYRQGRTPFVITLAAVAFYVIASLFVGFTNPFNHETGFGTLLFVWDFSTIVRVPEEGAGILINWPQLINTPHFVKEAWVSYIFVPVVFAGGLWYLFTVQGFIARFIQIKRLGQKIYNEQLENYISAQGYPQQPTPPGANPIPNQNVVPGNEQAPNNNDLLK